MTDRIWILQQQAIWLQSTLLKNGISFCFRTGTGPVNHLRSQIGGPITTG